ncbi:MAG: type II toxin-antitoxin system HicB family antitoxin [Oscillospiraceae bacterium]|jgi:predicted RNase H-like HicB family nuclease|nr:type II toxin-antitoxin system HicB family antitoxin [Oscillospiraceae bacterium]
MMELKITDFLCFPYKRIITPTGEEGGTAFFADAPELDGCCAEGATYEEADEALTRTIQRHIQMYLNKGLEPPRPNGC